MTKSTSLSTDIIYSQSNNFIESPFAQEFTGQELKTMEFIISQTKRSDIELAKNNQVKLITLSVANFAKMIDANPTDIYKRADELGNSLMDKKIKLKTVDKKGNASFVGHSFFPTFAYENGIITIGINPFVLPYFVDIHDNFTEFNLSNILKIGSAYGIKLYKLLKQYENTPWKYRDFTIEKLRDQFGIAPEKYKLYSNLKAKVIDTAVNHINSKTDIQIHYEESKLGRKIDKLRFYIKSKMSQYEQAKIIFDNFMNNLPDEALQFRDVWEQSYKDKEKRFERFKPAFNKWVEMSCHNYSPHATDLLHVSTEDSLIFDKQKVINEIYLAYIKSISKKRN